MGSEHAQPSGGGGGTAIAERGPLRLATRLPVVCLALACALALPLLHGAWGVAGVSLGALGLALAGALLALGRMRRHSRELEALRAGARQAQQALVQREAQLAQAVGIANLGYFIHDLETHTSSWSPELCRIVGAPVTARSAVGTWWKHIHPEDRPLLERQGRRAVAEGLPSQDEFRMIRADGKTRWVYGRLQALRDAAGKPIELLGTVQDVTEQKELQAQLAAAERLATVGTLAAGVAHEINNPLSSVISNLEFVLEELRRQPAQACGQAVQAAAGEALQGAERVSSIVRDLMAFSRSTDELGPIDVVRVLELSVKMAGADLRCRARLVKEYGPVPLARGEGTRLGQVFLNVLVNAAQSIPAGRPEDHEIRIATRLEGDKVLVSVRDTGEGMAPEVLRKVFEPFFSTKPVGSGRGLGLYTSLAAVRAMGGDIVAESERGAGSTFTVTLPALPGTRQQGAPTGPRRRVLIIDDEPLVVAALGRELAAEHEVRYAADGRAGLEAVAREGPYDAILCDLEMPGLNGRAVHEVLRRRDPEAAARMVFLTDGAVTRDSRAFLAATHGRLVAKPVSAEDVRKLLRAPQ